MRHLKRNCLVKNVVHIAVKMFIEPIHDVGTTTPSYMYDNSPWKQLLGDLSEMLLCSHQAVLGLGGEPLQFVPLSINLRL